MTDQEHYDEIFKAIEQISFNMIILGKKINELREIEQKYKELSK